MLPRPCEGRQIISYYNRVIEKMLDGNKKTNKLQKNGFEKKNVAKTQEIKMKQVKKTQNMQATCYRAKRVLIQHK